MKRFQADKPLSANQESIVKSFMQKFLPKRGNKRKHSGNELEYVTNVINRVTKQQFGFNLNSKNLLQCFEELQYDIFTRKGDWNSEQKQWLPSKKGEIVQMGGAYSDYDAMCIYIDVDATVVRELKLSTSKLPPNANEETHIRKNIIDEKIALFKKAMTPLLNQILHG